MYELLLTTYVEMKPQLSDMLQIFISCLEKHFTVIKYTSHIFDLKEGEMTEFTIVVVLGESHAILHTYPEKGIVYINLSSCKGTEEGMYLPLIGEKLCKELKLKVLNSRLIQRG